MSGGDLVVQDRGGGDVKRFELRSGVVTLGAHPDCDIRVLLPHVLDHHATMAVHARQTLIRDLSNGSTLVNGSAIGLHALQHGDVITVGDRSMRWEYSRPDTVAKMTPRPALVEKSVRRRGRGRGSEGATRRLDPDVHLALEMKHRASMPGGTKQVAIVQPRRRDAAGEIIETKARLITKPHRPHPNTIRRTPKKSPESSTSQLSLTNSSRKKTPKKSPKLSTLHSETKASQWIASRKTPRKVSSVDMTTPKSVVYVHVATPRPVNPYVEKSPSKMLASNSPKKVVGKKATPLRQLVLRKAVTPKVTPASKKVSPRKSRGTPRNKVEKIQAPLVMDEKKKAALMMITRTPQSKLLAARSAIPVLVKKTTGATLPKKTVVTLPKTKATVSPKLQIIMSPKTLSVDSNRSSRGRKRQSGNRSDSVLDSTDSEVSQTRSTRSNMSLPDAVTPLPPSPHKSALKNPQKKKKHNKTESIKFDLSNLETGNDTSDLLFITNDASEDEMSLHYSDISPQSSPNRSLTSRSSKILEKSLGKMPSFSSKASIYSSSQSPKRSKSTRGSLILQNAYDNKCPSPSTSRRSNLNMETYSIVDLVSLDSNGSDPSVYSSADSTSTSSIVFGTPNERRVLSRSRGKSSIAPNLVSSSTPFDQNTPRASRSKENVKIPQKRSFSTPEFVATKDNSKRSKSLSTPIRNGNSFIINSCVAQSDMDDSTFVEASTFSRNNSSITLFGDTTTSPKSSKNARNTTNSTYASVATSPRRSRSQLNISNASNATITKSPRRSRSQQNICDATNVTITKSPRRSRSQLNISDATNVTITKSPRRSQSQLNISDATNATITKSPQRSGSLHNISNATNATITKSYRKSRTQDNIDNVSNTTITLSPRRSRSQQNISDVTNGSLSRSSRKSNNRSNTSNATISISPGNISDITNTSITIIPRKSRSQISDITNASVTTNPGKNRSRDNISDLTNASITTSPRKTKSQQSISDVTNASLTKSSRNSDGPVNISNVTNTSMSKSSRRSQNHVNISNVSNSTMTISPRQSHSRGKFSDISNASTATIPRKSRSQLNISDVTNASVATNSRKSRSRGNISDTTNASINVSVSKSRSQDNIKTNEITPNISSRRTKSQSAGRGSSKKNTPNNDGQVTPENQSISSQDAGTPVLHMVDLLVPQRPISNRKLGRKTIQIITHKKTSPIQRANTDPKKRGRVSRTNFKSAKKLLLRRQSHDSGNSNETDENAPKPRTDDKSTPKSSVKLVPEEVKQKHSTAKKTKSKRSMIDNLDDSDIVKQLFNSPVKRKLSQSMTVFNRSLNLEKKANNKRTRRTIAVFNVTPEQSFVEENIETPNVTIEKFVSPLTKTTKTPNLEGINRLFKKNSPKNDLTNVRGVKSLLRTPRTRKSPKNDLSNVSGVKDVFKRRTPRNDLTNIRGVKQVFVPSPKNDLRRVSGVKALFQSQNKRKSVKNDLRDVRGVKRMFRQNKSQTGLTDLSGVEELFTEAHTSNTENLFDQLVGKPVIKKTYSKSFISKRRPKSNTQASTSLIPVDSIFNNVEEWLDDEINRRLQKDTSINKGASTSTASKILSKSKNVSLNKSKRELQRLTTDTVSGGEPLLTSRNRSQFSNSAVEKSLPLKKRSLVNISGNEKRLLPIKKRVIVHSTPVKANRTLLETTEMGRVSPIALTDTTDIEAVIVRSPAQLKVQSQIKLKVTPKKRGRKSKQIPTEANKTPPKLSPRKTRTSKAVPKLSPIKNNVKRRKSSLVVTKKAPIMSPKNTQNTPKQTNKKIQKVTPKKESPIKKRVGRSTRAAIATSPGRRNAIKKATPPRKATPPKKATLPKKAATPKKETPKPKRGRAKTVIEVAISPKPRSTRAKPKPITPKPTKTNKKVVEPAVIITKVTPKFSPEVKKTRNTRQVKVKEVKIDSPPKPRRGRKVVDDVPEEPRGRKRKTVDSPKVVSPKPKRNAKKTVELSKTVDKSVEKKTRGRKAKAEEVPVKQTKKSEEVVEKTRRGNAKIVKPVEIKKPATKKAVTAKPVAEAKPTTRKRKADTPPPAVEPPQRRARGKKVEPEPVRSTRGTAQATTSTRTARTRK